MSLIEQVVMQADGLSEHFVKDWEGEFQMLLCLLVVFEMRIDSILDGSILLPLPQLLFLISLGKLHPLDKFVCHLLDS